MPKTKQAISHDIWCPTSQERINGKKIAIVGYSHYHHEGQEDRASLTREVVGNVVNGSEKHAFFTKIRDGFGYSEHKDFWSRVYFFNYLPASVGTPERMYCAGDESQISAAQNRFLRFLEDERPDAVFVFTRKGWKSFPENTVEETAGGVCNVLLEGSKSTWGTYMVGDKKIRVCGLTHPQYAETSQLREEVLAFLEIT